MCPGSPRATLVHEKPVLDSVRYGLPGRLDDVRRRPHGAPALAVQGHIDEHPCCRGGAVYTVEDAHLVVGELDLVEAGEHRREGFAERAIEGVDGTVSLARGVVDIIIHPHLDGCFGYHATAVSVLYDGGVVDEFEGRCVCLLAAVKHHCHRRFGGLEREPARLELLDARKHIGNVAAGFHTELFRLAQQVSAPGELAHDDAHLVPYQFRIDVLIGLRVPPHRGHVDAALVGEGAAADVCRMIVGREVCNLGDEVCGVEHLREVPVGQALCPHLELEVRHDGAEIRIPAALAVSVHGSLHVHGTLSHGGQRVGHPELPVVVGVHTEGSLRKPRANRTECLLDIPGQPAAIGVTKNQDLRPGARRRGQGLDGVVGISGETVEEMLGIVDHAPPL